MPKIKTHQDYTATIKQHRLEKAAPRLQAALQPLAAFFTVIPDDEQTIHRDDTPLYGFDGVTLTYGDVREAYAAIKEATGA